MTDLHTAYLALFVTATAATADPATIEAVRGTQTGDSWRFDVTLSHPDTGWDHYADGWRVLLEDGTVLATRVLHHPHVNEQPFTRSQSGIVIPNGITQVRIQAKDNLEGWASDTVAIDLSAPTYTR